MSVHLHMTSTTSVLPCPLMRIFTSTYYNVPDGDISKKKTKGGGMAFALGHYHEVFYAFVWNV